MHRPGVTARSVILLLPFLLIAACASSRAGGPAAATGTSIMRVSGVPPVGSLTIYILNDVGARRLVGYVSPGQNAELRFTVPAVGSYRFVAQTVGGEAGLSNVVYLRPGNSVNWDLTTNIALVDESR